MHIFGQIQYIKKLTIIEIFSYTHCKKSVEKSVCLSLGFFLSCYTYVYMSSRGNQFPDFSRCLLLYDATPTRTCQFSGDRSIISRRFVGDRRTKVNLASDERLERDGEAS